MWSKQQVARLCECRTEHSLQICWALQMDALRPLRTEQGRHGPGVPHALRSGGGVQGQQKWLGWRAAGDDAATLQPLPW